MDYGIDTSILVRLCTGHPEEEFERCRGALTRLVEDEGARIFASNQVIGESYIALQHHYGVSKADAREALASVLQSALVGPMNGAAVLDHLAARGGCGLLDRLIADDYQTHELRTLTLDRRMAALPHAERLVGASDSRG
jgi:predicted nucleic acid-binding protein